MNISIILDKLNKELSTYNCTLVAVSKTKPSDVILEAYNAGQREFGENKVQELAKKSEMLPKDIKWHMIGHLQSNKVKYIAPFVHLIHAVDSPKLLNTINKEAAKNERVINCLLQVHIADEESKYGMTESEIEDLIESAEFLQLKNIKVVGLMGMATNTFDESKVSSEFQQLNKFLKKLQKTHEGDNLDLKELSTGMSGDYQLALKEGSTMVRIGSTIFGARNYP
ncbi:MAG: YggS family pyridoxal phosphate-dependent enzyme [Cyclobacteriaceae bacterium]